MAEDDFLYQYEIDLVADRIEEILGGESHCPMCGTNHWVIEYRHAAEGTIGSLSTPVFVMKDPRGHFGGAPSIPAVAFTCTNCGFLRLHNWSWIMSKIAEEEKGKDKQGNVIE